MRAASGVGDTRVIRWFGADWRFWAALSGVAAAVWSCGGTGNQLTPLPAGSGGGSTESSGGSAGNAASSGGSGTSSTGGQNTSASGGSTTGGNRPTGGTSNPQGGTGLGTGGKATGGVAAGGVAAGGVMTGGAPTGGTASGGSGTGGISNQTAYDLIDGWITQLRSSCQCKSPNTNTNCRLWSDGGSSRAAIINAIIGACEQFGPPESLNPGWNMQYCYAHLMAAVNKESSYNVTSVVEDSYGGSQDPTVGLTQIRFSSTVCDFYTQGPLARLEAIGCTFPADFAAHASESCSATFWKTTGGSADHIAWMQTPACNIGLGAWYYYTYATGGGPRTSGTLYLSQYCSGSGDSGPHAATLATGLLSHLRGPSPTWASATSMDFITTQDSGIIDYVSEIRDRMDCALGTISGTHPLFVTLNPNKVQYCK